eukprot:COSAG01_NODE_29967_length_626_cov_0.707780_1_plen_39_part_01
MIAIVICIMLCITTLHLGQFDDDVHQSTRCRRPSAHAVN